MSNKIKEKIDSEDTEKREATKFSLLLMSLQEDLTSMILMSSSKLDADTLTASCTDPAEPEELERVERTLSSLRKKTTLLFCLSKTS